MRKKENDRKGSFNKKNLYSYSFNLNDNRFKILFVLKFFSQNSIFNSCEKCKIENKQKYNFYPTN